MLGREVFIGPRCPWSDLWVRLSLSIVSETPSANLTDVTLADEDTNSILTDDKNNRTIQGNVAMQIIQSG